MTQYFLKVLGIFFLKCLSYVVLGLNIGLGHNIFICDRERIILTDKYGTITNGNEYHKDSHCEWLIKGMTFIFIIIFIQTYGTYI